MADIRVTVSKVGGKFSSRQKGTPVSVQINTFGLTKLQGITGDDLVPIVRNAAEPVIEQAEMDWPKDTLASVDSMDLVITEVGPKMARVALTVGGDELIADPRNVKKIDYAPFIEFNGTSTTPPGTISSAVIMKEAEFKARVKAGVADLIRRRLG